MKRNYLFAAAISVLVAGCGSSSNSVHESTWYSVGVNDVVFKKIKSKDSGVIGFISSDVNNQAVADRVGVSNDYKKIILDGKEISLSSKITVNGFSIFNNYIEDDLSMAAYKITDEQYGYFIVGKPTNFNELPKGSVTYKVSDDWIVTANFATKKVAMPAAYDDIDFKATIKGNTFAGINEYSKNDTQYHSYLEGGFFGANAHKIGAVFTFSRQKNGQEAINYRGCFTGDKQ